MDSYVSSKATLSRMGRVLLVALAVFTTSSTGMPASAEAWLQWHEWLSAHRELFMVQTGPRIPPAFRANVEWGGVFVATGVYFRDLERQRWRFKQTATPPVFGHDYQLHIDTLSSNASSKFQYNVTLGQDPYSSCHAQPSRYMDTFAALAKAVYQGRSSVAGEPCELWAASIRSGISANVSACIGHDGVPRQFNQTANVAFKGFGETRMTLSNISVGPVPDEVFQPGEACVSQWPSPPCDDQGVRQLVVYRSHSPKEANDLENKDVGDALGDMAFFCAVSTQSNVTTLVTSWAVSTNSSWGGYAFCVYIGGTNKCLGGDERRVGREGAMGVVTHERSTGQCSENSDVGNWFSFPGEGHCPPGTDVGHEGCTWTAQPLRTVSANCILEERGLRESCAQERGRPPLLRSAAIFRAALQSADPSKGGCPDVGETQVLV